MTSSFTVYIDESGDEGFKFRDAPEPKGSSDWFVLSAIIVPTARDAEVHRLAGTLRKALDMQPKEVLHFSRLSHEKRIRAVHDLAASGFCLTSVIINKRKIKQPEIFCEKPFRLYFYAARLLLERVSWYCRDAVPRGQPHLARIIFEHRKRLSYEALRSYLTTLQQKASADAWLSILLNNVRIDWGAVNPAHVQAAQKGQYAGLQFADLAASGIRWALEPQHGHTEHRFAKMLAALTYKRGNNFTSYGLKFFPELIDGADPRCHWIKKHYT